MFLVERTEENEASLALQTKPIKVSYSAAAGTALVIMDEVVVPPENLIGAPGQGFYQTVRARPGGAYAPFAFPRVHRSCMALALLYGRAGHLTAQSGGSRPGQMGNFNIERWQMVVGGNRHSVRAARGV